MTPRYGHLDETAQTKNSAYFILFLEHLLVKGYLTDRVVLVQNNASYHKSASALATLRLFVHRVLLIWVPTYCSDLNPIEFFLRYLKDQTCANNLQDDIVEVLKAAKNLGLSERSKLQSALPCV